MQIRAKNNDKIHADVMIVSLKKKIIYIVTYARARKQISEMQRAMNSLCEPWSITKHDLLQKKSLFVLHTRTISNNDKIPKLKNIEHVREALLLH